MHIKPVTLQVEGIDITGQLYLPDEETPHPAVCICHGIPSGKPRDPNDGGYPALAAEICQEGFAVLIFNFRGCGDSSGNLDIFGWTKDLAAAITYLTGVPEIDKYKVVLLGFSGGAAVSIYVGAQDNRISSVIACASPAELDLFTTEPQSVIDHFRSIGVIRDADFPSSIKEWSDGFNLVSPIKYVAGIAPRPLLLVHGLKDETVDISHAYRLYSRAGEPKRLAILDDAGHRLRQNEDAICIVIDWLKHLYQATPPEPGYVDPLSYDGL